MWSGMSVVAPADEGRQFPSGTAAGTPVPGLEGACTRRSGSAAATRTAKGPSGGRKRLRGACAVLSAPGPAAAATVRPRPGPASAAHRRHPGPAARGRGWAAPGSPGRPPAGAFPGWGSLGPGLRRERVALGRGEVPVPGGRAAAPWAGAGAPGCSRTPPGRGAEPRREPAGFPVVAPGGCSPCPARGRRGSAAASRALRVPHPARSVPSGPRWGGGASPVPPAPRGAWGVPRARGHRIDGGAGVAWRWR